MPPTTSSSLEVTAGGGHRVDERPELVRGRLAERVKAIAVLDQAAHDPRTDRHAAEPQPRTLGAVRLRLEVDVLEPIVATSERSWTRTPQRPPRHQVLVEQFATALERDAERRVLLAVPAHRRLDNEPPLAQKVERGELVGEQDRVPQRRDDRRADQPQPGRDRRDRAHEHDRVGPRRVGVLVSRSGVVARVRRTAKRPCGRPEHDVLAQHHTVDPGVLGFDGHPHQGPQIARRGHRPVLGQDENEARRRPGEAQDDANVTRTGSRLSPLVKFVRWRTGLPASSMRSTRSTSSSRYTRSSSRARCAPRHWCGPPRPNVR